MIKLNGKVSDELDFYQDTNPEELIREFGSPLYVYNERILRGNCRDLMAMVSYPHYSVHFSCKANSNLALLQIVAQEGLNVDAMSPGEINVALMAGFKNEQIFYIPNNVSEEEMRYAVDRDIMTSVDSLSQLEMYGRVNPGGRVAMRFNPGVGVGHHVKVVTAGKNTKFGIDDEYIEDARGILKKYGLKLAGINQHLGSLFMEGDRYLEGFRNLLSVAARFEDLTFIDLGGGFGIPYHKQDGEKRLDLEKLGEKMESMMREFVKEYGKEIQFKIEPGRYVTAEAGILLGTVHAIKGGGGKKYIGTDIGQNVLARPTMYAAHHDIEVYRPEVSVSYGDDVKPRVTEMVNVVGNICESGDYLAKDRELPAIEEGDLLGVLDAGSYGFVMSSNYNNRLRPAEVLIRADGRVQIIRERDSIEDITRNMRTLD